MSKEKIFKETTTLGVRVFLVKREVLNRKFKTIKTSYGKVKVKLGILDGQVITAAPEYEDLKKIGLG